MSPACLLYDLYQVPPFILMFFQDIGVEFVDRYFGGLQRSAFVVNAADQAASAMAGPMRLAAVVDGERVGSPDIDYRRKRGLVEEINVDIADSVARGQVVARLDNAEYLSAVTQAESCRRWPSSSTAASRS